MLLTFIARLSSTKFTRILAFLRYLSWECTRETDAYLSGLARTKNVR